MRNRRQHDELTDLIALAEHRMAMRALGRATAATRSGESRRSALAEIVDLDAERTRRRSNVLLLERDLDDPA